MSFASMLGKYVAIRYLPELPPNFCFGKVHYVVMYSYIL